jgi:nitrite reductase/ring-hydroxylating ferredoxin subunit
MTVADATLVRVAARGDVPDDAGLCVTVGDRQIALFDVDGAIVAIGNVCPHQGAPLADGFYEDGIVECPMHGWMFDVRTGRALNGTESVRTYAVVVEGDDVFVRPDPPG